MREQDRFDYWHDLICRLFPRASGLRRDERPFLAHLERNVLGPVEVSDISCSALRWDRARLDQRLDQNEVFLFSLMLEGRARLEQGGRVAVQEPGDFVLYDAAQPFTYDFPQNYRFLLAKIPRRAMLSRLPHAERLTAVTVASATPLGGLAANMMRTVATLDAPKEASTSAKIGTSLVDLLSAAIEMELCARKELCDRQAALLERAKVYMRVRLDEPDLDVERIANALHVSARTLSRAFSVEGTTVIRWLWKERLEAGYNALREGRALQVTDAALGSGFTSGSHFTRMFKSTYGVLPHTLLRGAEQVD